MGDARDFALEVHFDIQKGPLLTHTFVSFLVSDLEFPNEMPVRVSLSPMEGNGPDVLMNMMGRPDNGGAVFGLASRDDVKRCLLVFFGGKPMHFWVDSVGGERLIRLPLPNTRIFETVFRESHAQVQSQPTKESQPMTIGADPRTLGLVILPPDEKDQYFKVCLMGLDPNGEIDWDKPDFILARTNGTGSATEYAKGLADILRIRVLQIVKS
jgi:hypothetical protein